MTPTTPHRSRSALRFVRDRAMADAAAAGAMAPAELAASGAGVDAITSALAARGRERGREAPALDVLGFVLLEQN